MMKNRAKRASLFLAFWAIAGAILLFGHVISLTDISQAIAFVFVGAGGSILLYGWGDRLAPSSLRVGQESAYVDDLENPEVRLRLRKSLKEEVSKLTSTEEAQSILRDYPHVKTLIDGLNLMDEREAEIKKLELEEQILLDDMYAQMWEQDSRDSFRAETLGKQAIGILTLPKGAKMLRKAEPTFTEKEELYRRLFPSAFHIYDALPETMTPQEAKEHLSELQTWMAGDAQTLVQKMRNSI